MAFRLVAVTIAVKKWRSMRLYALLAAVTVCTRDGGAVYQ
jgi:hypothetical protein